MYCQSISYRSDCDHVCERLEMLVESDVEIQQTGTPLAVRHLRSGLLIERASAIGAGGSGIRRHSFERRTSSSSLRNELQRLLKILSAHRLREQSVKYEKSSLYCCPSRARRICPFLGPFFQPAEIWESKRVFI
jgi:hypothetical protein